MKPASTIPQGEVLLVATVTILLAAVFAVLATPSYRLTGDPDHYVGLARAIAAGDSYSVNGRPEVRFPPGFPLVLAPAAWLADGSFAAINRWAAALASLVFPLTWLYARRREGWLALPIALLTACSVPFLSLATGNPMSEPVYLALSMGLLLWAERERGGTSNGEWPLILLGCLLLVALPAVRTIGIAGVTAAGLVFLADARNRPPGQARARIRDALPVAAGLLFVAGWLVWTRTHRVEWYAGSRGGGYGGYFFLLDPHHPDLGQAGMGDVIGRVAGNFLLQTAHVGELLTPIPWVKAVWYSPVTLAIPLLLAGWWREFRTVGRFGALYFLFYLVVILLWPFDEGARFLLPLAPLLWIYLFEGARQLGRALRENRSPVRILGVLWCVAALAGVVAMARPAAAALSRQDLAAGAFWAIALVGLFLGWRRLVELARRWTSTNTRILTAAGVTLFVVGSVAQAGPLMFRRAWGPATETAAGGLTEAARWIAANTPPDAVIQSTYATRINFATGRPAVPLPVTVAPAPFLEIQRRYRPTFVVVLDSNDGYVEPSDTVRFDVLQRLFPGRWQQVHQFAGGRIYGVR